MRGVKGRESSHSAVTFPFKPKIHQQQNMHTPGSQTLTQAWGKNAIKMNKNPPKFKIIGQKRPCTIKRKLLWLISRWLYCWTKEAANHYFYFSGLTFGIRGMLDQTRIYLEIFKVCKMKERVHSCKLPFVWHCFSISWTSWQQNLMKPDEAPSGVSCKLFMNTDSAVLYSAELEIIGNVQIKMHQMSFITVVHVQRLWYNHKNMWQQSNLLLGAFEEN